MIPYKCLFRPNLRFLWQKNQKIFNFRNFRKNDEEGIFSSREKRFHLIKNPFLQYWDGAKYAGCNRPSCLSWVCFFEFFLFSYVNKHWFSWTNPVFINDKRRVELRMSKGSGTDWSVRPWMGDAIFTHFLQAAACDEAIVKSRADVSEIFSADQFWFRLLSGLF